jgi:ElaB/YqjD/DUF883 family membrane-anchored ribosome-binding protein
MPNDVTSKKHASATTSPIRPRLNGKLPETEYLRMQAEDAQDAAAQTLRRMRKNLADAGDVRAWTRAYPWPSVGLAAALGFLAVRALAPARRRAEKETHRELVERLLADEDFKARLAKLSGADGGAKSDLLNSAVSSLIKTLGGALESALVAGVAAWASGATSHNRADTAPQPDAPGESVSRPDPAA